MSSDQSPESIVGPGEVMQAPPEETVLLLASSALGAYVRNEYELWGPSKPMIGLGKLEPTEPKYYLLRKFAGENDLLVILNTQRCGYQCWHCTLPFNSSREAIGASDIMEQFRGVAEKHGPALSIIEKVTLSNDGSVLDEATMAHEALTGIVAAIGEMRRVRRIDLETRLEYVRSERLGELNKLAKRASVGILTGFETVDEDIREGVLKKRESLVAFRSGLDVLGEAETPLTAYVMFKPDPAMTDEHAIVEAQASIDFLAAEASQRGIPLMVRLNPTYRAIGSRWAQIADATPNYQPPRLSDVMKVAQASRGSGVPTYIGLSVEGRADTGTYRDREDYQQFGHNLIKQATLFNDGGIDEFVFPE